MMNIWNTRNFYLSSRKYCGISCKRVGDVIAHSCSSNNPEMGKGGNASMVKNRSPAREANRCRKVTQIRGQVSDSYGCSFNIFLPELEYVDA